MKPKSRQCIEADAQTKKPFKKLKKSICLLRDQLLLLFVLMEFIFSKKQVENVIMICNNITYLLKHRNSHRRWSVKNAFLEISQNSQENTRARASLLIKLQARGLQFYLKKDSGAGVFL